jgi:hypothetical protein
MIARVASFAGVNVEVAERTIERALSVIAPLMEGLPGYQGHLEYSGTVPGGPAKSIH